MDCKVWFAWCTLTLGALFYDFLFSFFFSRNTRNTAYFFVTGTYRIFLNNDIHVWMCMLVLGVQNIIMIWLKKHLRRDVRTNCPKGSIITAFWTFEFYKIWFFCTNWKLLNRYFIHQSFFFLKNIIFDHPLTLSFCRKMSWWENNRIINLPQCTGTRLMGKICILELIHSKVKFVVYAFRDRSHLGVNIYQPLD